MIPWTAACQASLSFTTSWSLLKLILCTESVILSNHLILCHPLLLLPSIFLCIRVFSNKSALQIRWPKYWSFSFSNSTSNEYSGLTSSKIGWFDPSKGPGWARQHHRQRDPPFVPRKRLPDWVKITLVTRLTAVFFNLICYKEAHYYVTDLFY